jgi:FkbM family methyltransferase
MYAAHPDLERDILDLCSNKTDGFFVDIGAHDGIVGNNTKLLEELGWSGICIEPHPRVFESLKKNRKCRVSNFAIWEVDTVVDFLALSGYPEMLSGILQSYDPRHAHRVKSELEHYGGESVIVKVEAKKFETIVKEAKIDFLSIDTEGSEMNILQQIDFSKYDIRLICVENAFGDPEFKKFFSERGYKLFQTYLACDQLYYKS